MYHDLAEEWERETGLPYVSAIWGTACGGAFDESIAGDFLHSRDHGLGQIDALAREWAGRISLGEEAIRSYLTENIHYVLDEECVEGMRCFFRLGAEYGVMPEYRVPEIG